VLLGACSYSVCARGGWKDDEIVKRRRSEEKSLDKREYWFKLFKPRFWHEDGPLKNPTLGTRIFLQTGFTALFEILHKERYDSYLSNDANHYEFSQSIAVFGGDTKPSFSIALGGVHGRILHQSALVAFDRYGLHLVPCEI
jgi:hypothetical protein